MSNDRNDDNEGLDLEDLLLSALTGKCPHELQLGRVMGVLGAVVHRNGGSLTLEEHELMALNGRALKIEMDRRTGKVEVSLVDGPVEEQKQPTHAAPPTRQ